MEKSSNQKHNERNRVLRKLLIATALCSFFLVVEVVGGFLAGSLAVLSDAAHLFADLASFAVAIAASHLASLPATPRYTYGLKRTESLAALFSVTSLVFVSIGLSYKAIERLVKPFDEGVDGKLMTSIAGIGVAVNVALALVLGEDHVHLPGGDHGHDHSHNHDGHNHGHHEHGHDHSHNHDGHNHEKPSELTSLIVSEGHCDHHEHRDAEIEHNRNVNLHAAYLHVLGDLAQSVAA